MFNQFQPKVRQIDTSDVKKALDDHKEFILLDVRTADECSKGKIAGSINIPLDRIQAQVSEAIIDKNSLIYIYCLSGNRSEEAARLMNKLGYTNVYNVKNGIMAWRAKGYKVS